MLHPVPSAIAQITTIPYGVVTITVKANGGSCLIEMLHNEAANEWVPAVAALTVDGAVTLFPGNNAKLRITPSGGATFTLHGPGF